MLFERALLALGLLLAGSPAISGDYPSVAADFSGQADFRASAADGEASWLDGGFGKTRVSGGGGSFDVHPQLADAFLAWTPHLTWEIGAVLVGQYQPQHDRSASLEQAYLTFRPTPRSETRFSVRVGLMYPPVSMEHEGPGWTDRDMITPSAINSWIGEEVKVIAAEATVRHDFAGQQISVTGAVFGFNDTAGTLLTTRGWALGDITAGAPDRYRLPPLSAFLVSVQAPVTNPVFEIDGRIGGYGRLDWRGGNGLELNAFYYDNGGNLVGDSGEQWAWRTRFANVGVRWDLDSHTHLLVQGMGGDTRFGYSDPDIWADTAFRAAYLLLRRDLGPDAISARIDLFATQDRTEIEYGDTREHGWALAADYRRRLSHNANLLVEILRVASHRPARFDILGEPASQSQTVLQASLRLSF